MSRNRTHMIYPAAHEFNSMAPSRQMAAIGAKGEFCDAVGNSFLKKIGTVDGYASKVYQNSWDRFNQREIAGLEMPDEKKRRNIETAATQNTAAPAVVGRAVAPAPSIPSFSHIHLPGEEIDDVKIYDTCDEIRRKINEHLKTPDSKSLAGFRAKKGPRAGKTGSVLFAGAEGN
ncbi:hypothetical protein DL764_006157 [Monosporascus ibericus]|uniref:Uncharacterized protein n=1 Tax=Monosporascus ibericus TaxID=155417 RepID=A0A4Q4T7I7_9PEZI|nr:hypothetical protein DL764_006157 [Monosporascus ibericus]